MFSDKFCKISNIIISIVISILSLIVIVYTLFYPKIMLEGSVTIELNYKGKYKETPVKAKVMGKDISKYIKVSGKVNPNKLGTYKVTYSINYHGLKNKIVKMLDNQPQKGYYQNIWLIIKRFGGD